MTVFATAVARIFADPNMAVDATWLPGGVPPGATVRAIRRAPDMITDFGGARLVSSSVRIDVMEVQMADPAEGDGIEIGGEAFVVQGEPIRDRERLIWTLDLRPR